MNTEEIIKALRDMAKYPTVTLPRDSEALKAAADLLAQPEQEPVAWEQFYPDIGKPQIAINSETVGYVAPQLKIEGSRHVICQCDKCKAQPEQEPVAWLHNSIRGNVIAHRPADIDRNPNRWIALYKEPKPCPTCEALARTVMLDQTSHDTTPPQRTWVGLDEEDDIDWEEGGSLRDLVKAIEAKLKEKNHG